MAAIKALEQWCKLHCEGYRDVAITNMTTSFRNGLAFCALIHKYRPDLIDYDSLSKEDVFENNRLAFQVAEEKLGIPALLDAEDMVALRIPDRLSILTYVSQYYNYFNGRPPMGGVKRPAEGSKEEPSEKKNLPVVAKTFVSKTATENRSPSTLNAQMSPKLARANVQKGVLAENSNKNGTLNSKCVACKSHVHLVQRHFVDGKLYHRSCFRCSECSGTLHAGGYKPGRNPDTFICNGQHASRKSSSSNTGIKNNVSQTQPASRPSSVLSAPLNITIKPSTPTPPSPSWTVSAQKTQSARQRFFQAAPPPTVETTKGKGKPTEPLSVLGRPKVPLSTDEERNRARTTIGKKLAEENCNTNNNKRLFTVRPAERRFGYEPTSADSSSLREDKCSRGPAGNQAGQPSTGQTNNKEFPRLKAISRDNTRPATVHTTAADPGQERKSKPEPANTHLALQEAGTDPCTKQHEAGFMFPAAPSNVSISTTRPPSAPTPAQPAASIALFDPSQFRKMSPQKPQHISKNQGESNLYIIARHICIIVVFFSVKDIRSKKRVCKYKSEYDILFNPANSPGKRADSQASTCFILFTN
ncbi:MICAL-like protein 2a [Xyrichtys novacula]|uniref:MICAL-like protein 2a n=1 Tax=Xyrichtys novacula TaxID=13765 RepID=A0AAV1GR63_XYRNO|nr:MICAL-like protein 2a [Xyrichtys novacula]